MVSFERGCLAGGGGITGGKRGRKGEKLRQPLRQKAAGTNNWQVALETSQLTSSAWDKRVLQRELKKRGESLCVDEWTSNSKVSTELQENHCPNNQNVVVVFCLSESFPRVQVFLQASFCFHQGCHWFLSVVHIWGLWVCPCQSNSPWSAVALPCCG